LNSKAVFLIPALICAGCATSVDPGSILTAGGAQISGNYALHYVSVSAQGPAVAYETGSPAGLATAFSGHSSVQNVVERSQQNTVVRVIGPEIPATQVAESVSSGVARARRWYPAEFSDDLNLSIEFQTNGPVEFSQSFLFQSSPWPMAFQVGADQIENAYLRAKLAGSMAHEGYHLANAILNSGKYLGVFADRRDAGSIYEEVSAHLIGACTMISLGAAEDLSRTPTSTLDFIHPETGETRTVTAPLNRDQTSRLVAALEPPHERNSLPKAPLYLGFYRTLFHHYAEGADVIEPGTPAAERLLAACDRVGPDVTQVPVELLAMAEDADDSGS
jgi:hypothetical protein